MMKMMEKFREYCEFEYKHALAAKELGLVDKDFVWYATQRLLGAGTFLQMLDSKINFGEIEEIFEEYREKLEKIS